MSKPQADTMTKSDRERTTKELMVWNEIIATAQSDRPLFEVYDKFANLITQARAEGYEEGWKEGYKEACWVETEYIKAKQKEEK